jgi:hypothetical protein
MMREGGSERKGSILSFSYFLRMCFFFIKFEKGASTKGDDKSRDKWPLKV